MVMILSTCDKYLALKGSWFKDFVSKELQTMHDCYNAKIEGIGATKNQRKSTLNYEYIMKMMNRIEFVR